LWVQKGVRSHRFTSTSHPQAKWGWLEPNWGGFGHPQKWPWGHPFGQNGGLKPPLHFILFFLKKKKYIYIYIYIWHVQPRVANVKIRQFWTEKLTEVPCSSFPIAHVPPMKKMKTDGAKNKFFKPQGSKEVFKLKIKMKAANSSRSWDTFIFSLHGIAGFVGPVTHSLSLPLSQLADNNGETHLEALSLFSLSQLADNKLSCHQQIISSSSSFSLVSLQSLCKPRFGSSNGFQSHLRHN
jgi:hypothetical protein